MATILEKIQEKYASVTGIDDARNIAEAMAIVHGTGGRGAGAIADHVWQMHTLTYNVNSGTGSVDPVVAAPITKITLDDGSDLTPPAGKEAFLGWATDASDPTTKLTSPIKIEEDTTVYALWGDIFTVAFNANGGTGTIESALVPDGESITLPDGTDLTAPTDKVFDGWGSSALATEAIESPYTPTVDVTLYAIWDDAPAEEEVVSNP